ncbi:hypothetical protein QBC40DRAFT_322290 [Triangularia verruculosa]|uniref:Polymerase nucleotidyl transferase domain-containing protein n=1 Tax=Triangularia verruculosa TaxID=2587418 RepID=A0AAN6XP95_9PEZI|nr:hypothetical protein QBC40DRAFT_322290 [Triangularia verruculosa]
MYDHHEASIAKIKAHFKADTTVLGLILTGSLAHGFDRPDSDVDVLIVVSEDDFARRLETGNLTMVSHDLCTYLGGFVDAKYTSLSLINQTAEKGSEPARWAYDGAKVLFSRFDPPSILEDSIKNIPFYQSEGKENRIMRFRVQLQIWRWYCSEGRKKNNPYLLNVAASKLVLFGGRLILAHNEILYPFHKWFLRVLGDAPEKPEGVMELVDMVSRDPSEENTERFFEVVANWKDWTTSPNRPGALYMIDSELNWLYLQTPIDDI